MIGKMKLLILCGASLSVLGCTSVPKEEIFRPDAPTMESVFYHGTSSQTTASNSYGLSDGRLSRFTRSKDNELEQLFPELPNKRLHVYVFPHLSGDYPVPGYTTAIRLYDKAQNFALPGER